METNGYTNGKATVLTFQLTCGRCTTALENQNGSRDLTLGDDFAGYLKPHGGVVYTSKQGCGYCGARVNVPAKLAEFLS